MEANGARTQHHGLWVFRADWGVIDLPRRFGLAERFEKGPADTAGVTEARISLRAGAVPLAAVVR